MTETEYWNKLRKFAIGKTIANIEKTNRWTQAFKLAFEDGTSMEVDASSCEEAYVEVLMHDNTEQLDRKT
jgi:hypothetical protein